MARKVTRKTPEPAPPAKSPALQFAYRFEPRNPPQREAQCLFPTCDVLGMIGPAGSGKTIAAVALGVGEVYARRAERITVIRPCVEAGENPLGWLGGSLEEKMDPHYAVFHDAIRRVSFGFPAKCLRRLAINFIRGETFLDEIVIVDEAQNFTIGELQLVLERLGERSRMVMLGDPDQPDIPHSGLVEFFDLLDGASGISRVEFTDNDIVRHPRLREWLQRLRKRKEGRT